MMNGAKIIIPGGTGFIGQWLIKSLNGREVIVPSRKEPVSSAYFFDAMNVNPSALDYVFEGDFVLYLAAKSSPDDAGVGDDDMYRVNVIGTRTYIESALSRGAKVVFFSSDTVYGKCSGSVNELSKPDPFSRYAEMKMEIEREFTQNPNFSVLHLSYVVANNDKFSSYLRRCAINQESVEIFHPFNRTAVSVYDLVEVVNDMINNWKSLPSRIINACGPCLISRLDMVKAFEAGVSGKLTWDVVEPPLDFFKNRPRNIDMRSLYFDKILGRQAVNVEAIYRQIGEDVGCKK